MNRIEKLLDMSIDEIIKLDAHTLLDEDNPSWLQDYIICQLQSAGNDYLSYIRKLMYEIQDFNLRVRSPIIKLAINLHDAAIQVFLEQSGITDRLKAIACKELQRPRSQSELLDMLPSDSTPFE